jgi:uncharacterized protein YkwD
MTRRIALYRGSRAFLAEHLSSARKLLAIGGLIAIGTLVTSPQAAASSCPNEGLEAPLLSPEMVEASTACLINEQRTARGLRPVRSNARLWRAGLRHSSEMVALGFFAHTTPTGVTFIERIKATGYTRGARSWFVGENLVWGFGAQSTPAALVTAWMNSPPHRENLLNGSFREIGVAAVRGTPQVKSNPAGITVSSEYGYRGGKRARKAKPRHHRRRKGAPDARARRQARPVSGGGAIRLMISPSRASLYKGRSARGIP